MPLREQARERVGVEGAGETAARRQLRSQVGRLESQLAALVGDGFGRVAIDHGVAAIAPAPRLLDLGELERVRDALAARVGEARATLAQRARYEAANRERLTALLEAPERHPDLAISRTEVGEPGCGGWRSAPRFGPLGRLLGWWRVKVSSGCPLAGRLAAVDGEIEAGSTAAAEVGRVAFGLEADRDDR